MSALAFRTLAWDLDNKWSYLKTHGDDSWQEYPSYLAVAVPRILDFLAERRLSITFFIVGQDAAMQEHHECLGRIRAAGHEIANHSFHHEPWLHLYSERQLDDDLARAEEAIEAAPGARVRGFRGPGFSLSEATLQVLQRRGYAYDATAFPNILNPLARRYFFAKSHLDPEEKKQRQALFGSFADALRPVKPYRWDLEEGQMLELPVTTMPVFKVPIHFSYLLYLSSFSPLVARMYTRFAVGMCSLTRTEPSLLLHPLDFLGREDDAELGFFPAMGLPLNRKMESMHRFFDLLVSRFRPYPIGPYLSEIANESDLDHFAPEFSR